MESPMAQLNIAAKATATTDRVAPQESTPSELPVEMGAAGYDLNNKLHVALKAERTGSGYLVRLMTSDSNPMKYGIGVARDHQSPDPSGPFRGLATGSLGSARVSLDPGCHTVTIDLVRTEPNKPREEYRFVLETRSVFAAPAPGSDAPTDRTQADPGRWMRTNGPTTATHRMCLKPPAQTNAFYYPVGLEPGELRFGTSKGSWALPAETP